MVLAFSVGPTNCVALFLCAKCHSKKRNNTVVKNGIVENSCQEGLLPAQNPFRCALNEIVNTPLRLGSMWYF